MIASLIFSEVTSTELEENLKNADLLYSYGIIDDVSFELDFLDKNPNCFVKLFDHTIDFLPENHKNFCFIKEVLSSRKQINTNTLKNHLKKYLLIISFTTQ